MSHGGTSRSGKLKLMPCAFSGCTNQVNASSTKDSQKLHCPLHTGGEEITTTITNNDAATVGATEATTAAASSGAAAAPTTRKEGEASEAGASRGEASRLKGSKGDDPVAIATVTAPSEI